MGCCTTAQAQARRRVSETRLDLSGNVRGAIRSHMIRNISAGSKIYGISDTVKESKTASNEYNTYSRNFSCLRGGIQDVTVHVETLLQ